jgi:hypothetical protein
MSILSLALATAMEAGADVEVLEAGRGGVDHGPINKKRRTNPARLLLSAENRAQEK